MKIKAATQMVAGLSLIPGAVRRFQTDLKVPHMGWNTVHQIRPAALFSGLPDEDYFYFVHSYYVDPEDRHAIAGVTRYAVEFPSVLWRDNILATQFHPEKSQQHGLRIIVGALCVLVSVAVITTTQMKQPAS